MKEEKTMSLKEYVKDKLDKIKKERAEKAGYNKILKEKAKVIDRQAYAKEHLKQVKLKAKRDAKAKFKPRLSHSGTTALQSAAGSFSSTVRQAPNQFEVAGIFGNAVPKAVKNYKEPAWDLTGGIFNKPQAPKKVKRRKKAKKRKRR